MKKNAELSIVKELALNEYILVFKQFMHRSKCRHATGFVNAPLLYERPENDRLEQLINDALKHQVLVRSEDTTVINPVIYTFINSWLHSRQVVTIKKASYSDQKGLFIARTNETYLAMLQDAENDRVVLAADPDIELLYDYFQTEIEKRDPNKQFHLKKANKMLKEKDLQLSVKPVNQIFMQCIDNYSGKKYESDVLLHIGKEQLEKISLDDMQCIVDVEVLNSRHLKECIVAYVKTNCTVEDDFRGGSVKRQEQTEDPEFYTTLSFMKLAKNKDFPKSFLSFLKMMAANSLKGMTNWKKILMRVGICLAMSVLTLVWNLYALCYLNDTFNINIRAVFGRSTAYLLAGVADTSSVIGLPTFFRTVNTVAITALLYYLLAVALSAIVRDIVTGKMKNNLTRIFSFGKVLKNYSSVTPRKTDYYIWTGLMIASVMNIVLFNPFTVFLLAVMLLVSCTKCEEGGLIPLFMMLNSSVKYNRVVNGKTRMPLFGEYQLRLFGIGIGLVLCSVLNAVLWFVLDFNFWVRITISVVVIVFCLLKLGIIKVSKPTAAAILVLSILSVQLVMMLTSQSFMVFADDGGWTESGGTLAGLMNNYGWQTVLGFSLTLAAAVAFGCLTFGLGTAVVAGAAAVTFGASAIGATFTETGRKTAYDFVWGNYSPYGGDSKLAMALNLGVSLVPGFGDAFGVITGIRDCSYDIKEGDWLALGLDGLGLALDVHGLIGEVGDVLKHGDDIAEAAQSMGKNADEFGEAIGKHGDEAIEAAVKNSDETINAAVKNSDESVEVAIKKSDSLFDEDQLNATKQKIRDTAKVDPIKANDEASEALRRAGKDAGYSEEMVDKYIAKLESDKQYDITKAAKSQWGEGWDSLTADEQKLMKDVISDDELTAAALAKQKMNGLDTLSEYRTRYDEGIFDTEHYSLDDILDMKISRNAGPKAYSGIEHSELLPRVDEFISDDAVVDYVKRLCPDNEAILKCDNLQEIADELYKNPVDVELVTFQNASMGGANILTFDGNFGNINASLESGGGVFSVPISKLSEYADRYSDICNFDNGTFKILDQERFGQEVLSGVPLSSADGAYMITTKVPFNGSNISMPSVNNWGSYMDQFVSGGRLLSGETEITQKALRDIVTEATSSGANGLTGTRDGVLYFITELR